LQAIQEEERLRQSEMQKYYAEQAEMEKTKIRD
jgi:hypothetical protein